MSIHLKIESKIKNNPMHLKLPKGYEMSQFVPAWYKTFEELHALEYEVQKLSKRARRNLI